VLGALLASSCCVLPLAFVLIGVSGAWIGHLTVLEPYKWWFIAFSTAMLVVGFYQAYLSRPEACDDATLCAKPQTRIVTKLALWLGLVLVAMAASVDWWAPMFY